MWIQKVKIKVRLVKTIFTQILVFPDDNSNLDKATMWQHRAMRGIEEDLCCFLRLSIWFHGHMGQTSSLGRSQSCLRFVLFFSQIGYYIPGALTKKVQNYLDEDVQA